MKGFLKKFFVLFFSVGLLLSTSVMGECVYAHETSTYSMESCTISKKVSIENYGSASVYVYLNYNPTTQSYYVAGSEVTTSNSNLIVVSGPTTTPAQGKKLTGDTVTVKFAVKIVSLNGTINKSVPITLKDYISK